MEKRNIAMSLTVCLYFLTLPFHSMRPSGGCSPREGRPGWICWDMMPSRAQSTLQLRAARSVVHCSDSCRGGYTAPVGRHGHGVSPACPNLTKKGSQGSPNPLLHLERAWGSTEPSGGDLNGVTRTFPSLIPFPVSPHPVCFSPALGS